MYERHFGFQVKPFALTPDPAFLFSSRRHAMALTMLEYGLESQASFFLLTGEIGAGKTLLVSSLLRKLGDRVAVGLVTHTHNRFQSIHRWAAWALGVVPVDDSDIAVYEALVDSLVREYARGRRTLLIFDEAQNLSIDVLEELRLLSNVNSEKDLVLQILLVGQPELRAKLNRPELKQFAQRVSVHFHLKALESQETHAYIRHRLQVAGGNPSLFSPEALELLHVRTHGVPRLLNQLCDFALAHAFADARTQIDAGLIAQVLRDDRSGIGLPTVSIPEPRMVEPGVVDPAPILDQQPTVALEPPSPDPSVEASPPDAPEPPSEEAVTDLGPLYLSASPQLKRRGSIRAPAAAAAATLLIAVAAWWLLQRPLATSTGSARASVATDIAKADIAKAPTVLAPAIPPADIPEAAVDAPAVAATPVAATPVAATPVAATPVAATNGASARHKWLEARARASLDAGDIASAQQLLSQAGAAGAEPDAMTALRKAIDAKQLDLQQQLDMQLGSLANQVNAAIESGALLDPPSDNARTRLAAMQSVGRNEAQTLRTQHTVQLALLAIAQDATRKDRFDVAQRFIAAAADISPSSEVTAAATQLRSEMDQVAQRSTAPAALVSTAEAIDTQSTQPVLSNASNLSGPTYILARATAPLDVTYPDNAADSNQQGYVTLEFTLRPDGTASDITVIEARPSGVFNHAATDAVRNGRFDTSELLDHQPTRARIKLKFKPG